MEMSSLKFNDKSSLGLWPGELKTTKKQKIFFFF
jgi:hypothetical protein